MLLRLYVDMFSLRSNSIYFSLCSKFDICSLCSHSICCLRQRWSLCDLTRAPYTQCYFTRVAVLATHIERFSAISSFVYLVCDEVCKTYRAARQRRISTLGRAERLLQLSRAYSSSARSRCNIFFSSLDILTCVTPSIFAVSICEKSRK